MGAPMSRAIAVVVAAGRSTRLGGAVPKQFLELGGEGVAAGFLIDRSRVGLTATTLESLGALGRGEGIACDAVALLRPATRST
jgi:CTP:molybdopterin cytidylyltransferase MocA